MEKNRFGKDNFFKAAKTVILAGTLSIPFLPIKTTHAEPDYYPIDGVFTGYYCERVVGYKGYDGGGNCGTPAYGGETISGMTAGCGSNWYPHELIWLENWPNIVECDDTGPGIAPNQVDLFFKTDQELHDARESGVFLTHGKVYKIN